MGKIESWGLWVDTAYFILLLHWRKAVVLLSTSTWHQGIERQTFGTHGWEEWTNTKSFSVFPTASEAVKESLLQPLDTSCMLRAGLQHQHPCKHGLTFPPFQSQFFSFSSMPTILKKKILSNTPEFGEMRLQLCSGMKKDQIKSIQL